MAFRLYEVLVRHWMRQLTRHGRQPHLRAVFLGDIVSTDVIVKGIYEGYQLDVLRDRVFSKLPSRRVCLDIGANIGNHACYFEQHFDRVIAFEPNPLVHHLLCANALGRKIETVHIGLSDDYGELWFKQNVQNLGGSLIVDDEAEADSKIKVMPLDDYVAEHGLSDIGFMKIDVEGHELHMLRGAAKTLEKEKPILAAEGYFKKEPQLGEDIEAFLRAAGYSVFYRMVPGHPLARWLSDRGFRLTRGLLSVLLPEKIKRSQDLEYTDSLLGQDHSLFIAATQPISGLPVGGN